VAKVVVVDDEPNIVLVLEMALRRAGLDVVPFTDPDAAMAWLDGDASQDVGVVLLDLFMPRAGGRRLALALAGDPRHEGVAVVLMTGAIRKEFDMLPAACYQALFAKPFDLREVVPAVKAFAQAWDARAAVAAT